MLIFEGLDNSASIIYDASTINEELRKEALEIEELPIGDGNLKVDIKNNKIWREELDISYLKQLKITEFNNLCEKEITDGLEFNGKHYDFDRDSQMNMSSIQGKITLMMVLGQPLTEVSWYESNQPCKMYSIQDFLTLCAYGEQFKTVLIEKCKTLKAQVRLCETQEELDLIVW